MLLSAPFCFERARFADCFGPEIGWQHEAVKDNRPMLRCTDEHSRPLACPSKLFVIHFHTYNMFTAGCPLSFGDLREYACSNYCPSFQTRNSRLCVFPQASIRRLLINLGPAIWCGHSGGPPCRGCTPRRQQSSLICSEQSLGWTVPLGLGTLFQTKRKYTQETQAGNVFSLLN